MASPIDYNSPQSSRPYLALNALSMFLRSLSFIIFSLMHGYDGANERRYCKRHFYPSLELSTLPSGFRGWSSLHRLCCKASLFEDKLLANLIGENMIKSQSRSIHHSCSTIIFSPDKRNPRRLILIYLFIPQQAPPSQLIFYKLSSNGSNLESTILGIHFPITQQHFEKMRGKLKVIDGDSLSRAPLLCSFFSIKLTHLVFCLHLFRSYICVGGDTFLSLAKNSTSLN